VHQHVGLANIVSSNPIHGIRVLEMNVRKNKMLGRQRLLTIFKDEINQSIIIFKARIAHDVRKLSGVWNFCIL
jgi:hypothetical protein